MTASRYAPIAIWCAALVACVIIVYKTAFTADLSAFLPRAPSQSEQTLVEQLRNGAMSRVILLGIEGARKEVLAATSKAFAERLRAEPAFASVNNGDNVRLAADQAFLWDNRYVLSSAVTAEHFTEAGLHEALRADADLLSTSAAVLVKTYLPRDPTGEMLHLFDELTPSVQPSTVDGVWMSEDSASALLIVQTKAATSDVDAQEAGLARLREDFVAAQAETQGAAGTHLIETGPVVFSLATRDRIKGDAVRFSALATILVASVLFTIYRSPRVLMLGLLPVISGAIAGIAAVSLVFGSVHGITLGFGVTLIGEAVDYPVYLFTQTIPGTRPETTLQRIWPTLRLGVLTSVFGFSAMLFSSFEGLAQLGAFSVAGLLTAVAVTRYVVPVLLPEGFVIRRPAAVGALVKQVIAVAPRLRIASLILVLATGAFLILDRNAFWDDELASLSPIPASDKDADQRLRSQLGAPDVGFLLIIDGDTEEAVLQKSERVAVSLQTLIDDNRLAGFQSPASFMPSKAAQETRLNAIPKGTELNARFIRAAADMPFKPDTFAPFFKEIEAARTRPLIDRQTLENTSFGVLVDTLLQPHGDVWQAVFPLRGVADPARMTAEIGQIGIPGVVFLNIKQDSDALFRSYRQQAVLLSLGGVLALLLLLAASLRAWQRMLLVVAPLAAAVLVTAATLLFFGQRLTIFHLIGLLLAVAVGSNYSLFFEREHEVGEAQEWMVASLALANLCTIIGFGVLSLSKIPVLHGIGTTVALGAVLSLVFSAILSSPVERGDTALLKT